MDENEAEKPDLSPAEKIKNILDKVEEEKEGLEANLVEEEGKLSDEFDND